MGNDAEATATQLHLLSRFDGNSVAHYNTHMAPARSVPLPRFVPYAPLRIAGRDATAAQLLQRLGPILEELGGSVQPPVPSLLEHDYTQVDESLVATAGEDDSDASDHPPALDVGYAGLSPAWRHRLRSWAQQPTAPAVTVLQVIYIASIECAVVEAVLLLKGKSDPTALDRALAPLEWTLGLVDQPSWAGDGAAILTRLALWWHFVSGPSDGWTYWWNMPAAPPAVREVTLGWQALRGIPLSEQQLNRLALDWGLIRSPLDPALARLRLDDLVRTLGGDPLEWALAQSGDEARLARPWRMAHRDLRMALPRPILRPHLEPLLAEAFAAQLLDADRSQPAAGLVAPRDDDGGAPSRPGYSLVLEFGHSRSEFYDFAVGIAQRNKGYQALLDENRRIIHRVTFGGPRNRTFWRLWDYVGNWTHVHVYVNGFELEKWQVWPWSDYLQGGQPPDEDGLFTSME